MKAKVAIIVGTRPEAVKMAPICQAMSGSPTLEPVLVSTGQHQEMLQQARRTFGLEPQVDLALMQANQGLAGLTARVLGGLSEWLLRKKPAAMLVHGDTTAFTPALAEFYAGIPVGHVEAGLRTYDFTAPCPRK